MKRPAQAFCPRHILRAVCLLALLPNGSSAQQVSDTVARLQRVYERLVQLSATPVWPGFRPDTIPYLFVLPGYGHVLINWGQDLPEGYRAAGVPRASFRAFDALRAASTSVQLAGHALAQVSVSSLDKRSLVGAATHEAFHTFAGALRSSRSYLGTSENVMLLRSYPVFDSLNEAQLALEGRLLAAALSAATLEQTRARIAEFLAVRNTRHASLGSELAGFETVAEVNEGLAEYALLSMESRYDGKPASAVPVQLLNNLNSFASQAGSLRLRFYRTGPAQAFLLDRLLGSAWKTRFLNERVLLQDLLASATSGAANADQIAIAQRREAYARIAQQARANLDRLRAQRRALADSLLAAPGLLLVLSASDLNRGFDWCGFDPQNMVHGSSTVMLHLRYFKACAGSSVSAEFNVPVIQDDATRELRAVVPIDTRITAQGLPVTLPAAEFVELQAVRIEARTVNATFARARLQRVGNTVRVVPHI